MDTDSIIPLGKALEKNYHGKVCVSKDICKLKSM